MRGLREGSSLREGVADDTGSLALVLLISIVGMGLAAVLVPVLLSYDRTTVFQDSRVTALDAAQAGVDVVTGRIRAAAADGLGDATQLPCITSSAPLTGAVAGSTGGAYSTYVSYYTNDPVGAGASPSTPAPTAMLCKSGSGTYDTATRAAVPSYALITSTGTDPSSPRGGTSGRTIVTTYVLKTTNQPIPAGQVRIYPASASSQSLCVDAGSAPTAGTVLTLQPCSTSTPPASSQLFFYRSDLTIQLITKLTPGYPLGLCLDTAVDASAGAPKAGSTVVLQPCQALGSPAWEQQWSFNDNGHLQDAVSTSATSGALSKVCMHAASQNTNQSLTVQTCTVGLSDANQAWVPTPSVGDGAAAAPQQVNFEEFGRCLDVTAQKPNATFLIDFPCKQNPLSSKVTWNQRWTWDATSGWLYVTTGGTQYCAYSPRTENGLVAMTPCSTPASPLVAAQLVWKGLGSSTSVPYAQRYTYVDSSTDATRCLGLAAPTTASSPWSVVVVATCDGGNDQKWNAVPNLGAPAFQNTLEK